MLFTLACKCRADFVSATVNFFLQTNTYQGILITNGTTSYAVFIYRCGLMGWSGSASIGYYAVGSFYQNHPLANSATANTIACVNSPTSVWSNVVYQLSFIPPGNMIHKIVLKNSLLWTECILPMSLSCIFRLVTVRIRYYEYTSACQLLNS